MISVLIDQMEWLPYVIVFTNTNNYIMTSVCVFACTLKRIVSNHKVDTRSINQNVMSYICWVYILWIEEYQTDFFSVKSNDQYNLFSSYKWNEISIMQIPVEISSLRVTRGGSTSWKPKECHYNTSQWCPNTHPCRASRVRQNFNIKWYAFNPFIIGRRSINLRNIAWIIILNSKRIQYV